MAQDIDPDWPPNPTTVREQIAWAYANFAGVSATWEEGNGLERLPTVNYPRSGKSD